MRTILFLLAFLPLISSAQIKVYETYDDYVEHKAIVYKEFRKGIMDNRNMMMVIDTSDKKIYVTTAGLWGFEYKGMLFRFDPYINGWYRLISQGKLCYYENGFAHLDALINKTSKPYVVTSSERYCFTKSLKDPVFTQDLYNQYSEIPSTEQFLHAKAYRGLYDCLFSEKPEYLDPANEDELLKRNKHTFWNKLEDYLHKLKLATVRKCVKEFNNDPNAFPDVEF